MTLCRFSNNDSHSPAFSFFMHKNHGDISHQEAKRNPGTKIEYLRVLNGSDYQDKNALPAHCAVFPIG